MHRCRCALWVWMPVALAQATAWAQQTPDLTPQLQALPGVVDVRAGTAGRGGGQTYNILFEQPIDHAHPAMGKFQQRVYLSHADFSRPVVLNTEGYAAQGAGGAGELGRMLGATNTLTVEHRYFGQSVPHTAEGTPWQYLTVKNAADDMHDVVAAIKKLYVGKWVSSGTSKGGQTALFYKCYYPDDVNATVAYVAPINIGQEDPRINHFIDTVGDEATRKKIRDLQVALFKREVEILPLVQARVGNDGASMGLAKAYEYGVLEYPYYFWQYGRPASAIPAPDAPAQTLANYYMQINTIHYYLDSGKKQFEAFLYQAFTEIGYYNYDVTDFRPFMKAFTFKNGDEPTNLDICPPGTKDKIVYNAATMAFVFNFLQYKANNVVYVYGETDAWSATQMQLLGRTNALKIVVNNASHNARIGAASAEQKAQFYQAMDEWLGMQVNRN
jgi:hypothetical protein